MGKPFLLAAAALLALGCAAPEKATKIRETFPVEGRGAAPLGAQDAEARARHAAREAALRAGLEAFLDQSEISAAESRLSSELWPQAASFFKDEDVLESRRSSTTWDFRLRGDLFYGRLAAELARMGLLVPRLALGRPKVALSLREAPREIGREGGSIAAAACRRGLLARGFSAVDLGEEVSFDGLGDLPKSLAAAREAGAQALIIGTVEAGPVDDRRLAGYFPHEARGSAELVLLSTAAAAERLSAPTARSVDLEPRAAALRALENWGETLAREALGRLGPRFQERRELTAVVLGVSEWRQARGLIGTLRALPAVSGVSLEALTGQDVRLRVTAERSSDEIAAGLLRIKDLKVRAAAVDDDSLELEVGDD